MVMANQRAIVAAGEEIYERHRIELEARSRGHFAVIDISSQQVFVAPSAEEAVREAQARGGGPFHLVRIGSRAAYRARRNRHGGDTRIICG
jgi:hypothetical protein